MIGDPTERVTKAELLSRIRDDRRQFDMVLARLPAHRLTEPVLPGAWSVKDVLAHIAWGEREALGVMRAKALVGSALWELPEDERNAAVVRDSRSRDVETILREYRTAFDEYLAAIERLSTQELNDPGHIAGLADRIPGWRPWRVLYDPGHYEEHRSAIEEAFAADDAPATTTVYTPPVGTTPIEARQPNRTSPSGAPSR